MTEWMSPAVRDMEGPAALPRDNGELAFSAPWEGRVFGLAVGLVDGLGLNWDEFRRRLMAAIAVDPDRPYYESWTAALEALAVDYGVTDGRDLERRAAAASP